MSKASDASSRRARRRHERSRSRKGTRASETGTAAPTPCRAAYHLTLAERWDDLFTTLTDFTYLEEKARRVAVVTPA